MDAAEFLQCIAEAMVDSFDESGDGELQIDEFVEAMLTEFFDGGDSPMVNPNVDGELERLALAPDRDRR